MKTMRSEMDQDEKVVAMREAVRDVIGPTLREYVYKDGDRQWGVELQYAGAGRMEIKFLARTAMLRSYLSFSVGTPVEIEEAIGTIQRLQSDLCPGFGSSGYEVDLNMIQHRWHQIEREASRG
jgi:hypothetical protein